MCLHVTPPQSVNLPELISSLCGINSHLTHDPLTSKRHRRMSKGSSDGGERRRMIIMGRGGWLLRFFDTLVGGLSWGSGESRQWWTRGVQLASFQHVYPSSVTTVKYSICLSCLPTQRWGKSIVKSIRKEEGNRRISVGELYPWTDWFTIQNQPSQTYESELAVLPPQAHGSLRRSEQLVF